MNDLQQPHESSFPRQRDYESPLDALIKTLQGELEGVKNTIKAAEREGDNRELSFLWGEVNGLTHALNIALRLE